jgi:hypothetical protein
VKACAEALQSAQKRTRFAFFLVLAASCIVLLMVLNLWQSRQLLNDLIKDTADKSEYMKAYSKHIADNSFYQLPALGIQITCDDVGILGPLALLVFSFFTVIAFKALNSQVKSAAKQPFEGSPLIRALLETEQPLEKPLYLILRILSFLPLAACLFVIAYGIVWHFFNPPNIDSLPALSKNIFMAKIMDAFGGFFTLLVLFCNRKTFQLSQETKTKARECIRRHAEV